MQDRYAGDVGDYGKFSLLRHIVNGSGLMLGVNWYHFPNERRNMDGRFTEYLRKYDFKVCDPDLHTKLEQIVSNERSIKALEEAGLFRKNPIYFSDDVDVFSQNRGQKQTDKDKRLELRREWKKKAISELSGADVLFLDPDNGLEIPSCAVLSRKMSGKYVYFEEIREFHKGKKLTIIYQHLNRQGTHSSQVRNRAYQLKDELGPDYRKHTVFAIRFRSYSPRAFFLIADPSVKSSIKKRLDSFLQGDWKKHWDK